MFDAVGISCVAEAPRGAARVPAPATHCAFVGLARHGQTVWAASEDINCRVARFVLGCDLTERGIETAAKAFVESKLARDGSAARRLLLGFPVLEPRQRIFVYFPIGDEVGNALRSDGPELAADVVVRFLRPEDAMLRLRALMNTTGERAEVRTAGVAAICADCTAAPLKTGRAAFSPGCPGSRREVPLAPDEVLVAFPASLERAANAA